MSDAISPFPLLNGREVAAHVVGANGELRGELEYLPNSAFVRIGRVWVRRDAVSLIREVTSDEPF